MDVIIRKIEEKDYIEVSELLFNDLWNRKISTDNVVPFFNKVKDDEQYITFVALLGNNVIGYISAITFLSAASEKSNMFLQGFVVKKEYQNKGIGTKLLKHTEDYAKTKGIFGIGLQSGVQRTDAHVFYEHNGYIKSNYFYKNF